jgi:hypothetical protein
MRDSLLTPPCSVPLLALHGGVASLVLLTISRDIT